MCEGDTALRARVDALLAARERSEPLPATQAETAGPTIKLDLADAPEEARRDFAQARTQLKLALGDKPGHDRGPNWPFTYQAETHPSRNAPTSRPAQTPSACRSPVGTPCVPAT